MKKTIPEGFHPREKLNKNYFNYKISMPKSDISL